MQTNQVPSQSSSSGPLAADAGDEHAVPAQAALTAAPGVLPTGWPAASLILGALLVLGAAWVWHGPGADTVDRTATSGLVKVLPPVVHTHSSAELDDAFCSAEHRRLADAHALASSAGGIAMAWFESMAQRYSQRCADRPFVADAGVVPAAADAIPEVPIASSARAPADPLVLAAQKLLAELGYDPGPVDGIPGERTRAAVQQWRATQGASGDEPVTIDARLVDALLASRNGEPRPRVPQGDTLAAVAGGAVAVGALPGAVRHAIERWCTAGRNAADLDGFRRCVNGQVALLQARGGAPDLSALDAPQRERLERICASDTVPPEPAPYYACLSDYASAWRVRATQVVRAVPAPVADPPREPLPIDGIRIGRAEPSLAVDPAAQAASLADLPPVLAAPSR